MLILLISSENGERGPVSSTALPIAEIDKSFKRPIAAPLSFPVGVTGGKFSDAISIWPSLTNGYDKTAYGPTIYFCTEPVFSKLRLKNKS